jgi:hypothetical protein
MMTMTMFGRGGACAVGVANANATSAQLRQSGRI